MAMGLACLNVGCLSRLLSSGTDFQATCMRLLLLMTMLLLRLSTHVDFLPELSMVLPYSDVVVGHHRCRRASSTPLGIDACCCAGGLCDLRCGT